MAFIPDQAIDDQTQLSGGAWRLYCFLARCRNQATHKCNPSVNLTMASIDVNRSSVYALRKELQAKGWAKFDGDNVTELYGFKSPKNQTVSKENKAVSSSSALNQSENSDSPKNQTEKSENSDSPVQKIRLISPKIQTFQSKNSDSHIRKNQQIEPAKEPAKEREALSGCLPILLDAYRNIAKDSVTQQQLSWQVQQIEGDGATVEDLKAWLQSRRSLSSVRFIAQDFRTWKESKGNHNAKTNSRNDATDHKAIVGRFRSNRLGG